MLIRKNTCQSNDDNNWDNENNDNDDIDYDNNGVNREIFHRHIIIRVALHKEYFDIHCFQSSWRKQKLMTFFSVGKAVQTILHKICGRNFDGVLQFISIAEVEVTWTYLI